MDYEVFLSFRGVDTRQGFTDILYEYMTMAGIRVFRDDDELEIGDKIDSILAGLASSKICIPIFSPKFAESKWCLREVAKMVDHKKTIVPVFYKVSPDDVKLKQGSVYWDDIGKLEGRSHEEEIDKWKNALKEAGSIKGRELGDKSYSQFCKELVDEVLSKLGPRKRLEIDHFTRGANKARAMKLLDMDSSEKVIYVGIHGMGGIGKTTITKLIYNEFLSSFDYCSFVPDVREFSSGSTGIKGLPKYLYEHLQPKSFTPFSQSTQIADQFKNRKVLLILDDVDSYEQIREIARESSWFGLGSRIIMTTRDKKVLEDYAMESRSEIRYLEMKELDRACALELFSRCAFGTDSPPSAYQDLSVRAVAYAGGLPLAITVIAKYLRNKKEAVWKEITERLKKTPPKEVKDKLMISYNALEEEHKKIFLDIACLFIGKRYTEWSNVFYMWEACGLCPRWSLEVLQSMSLVKVDKDNTLKMHDQLRDLGRDIVTTQSERDLTNQSRFWEHDKSVEVLKCKKNKNNIEAIELQWNGYNDFIDEDFTSFDNLRYLRWQPGFWWDSTGQHREMPSLKGNFSGLLSQLKWLDCRSIIQTRNLAPSKLVILDLSDSDVNENWDGWSQIQVLKKLKVLNLSFTEVRSTPVFSENMALERLSIEGCVALTYIHPSIGNLHHLNYLNISRIDMDDAKSIENLLECLGELHALQELHLQDMNISSLPNFIRRLEKLEHLNLSMCRSLFDLPEWLGNLRSLVRLNISQTNINRLPCSIGGLEKLEYLDLSWSKITLLPESFGNLRSLVRLDISYTHNLIKLPCSIGGLEKLEYLNLRWSVIKLLPTSFGDLKSLVVLDISGAPITALPSTINRLSLLQNFKLDRCPQLRELPELPSSLTRLDIDSKYLKKVSDLSNLQDVTSLKLIGGSSILEWNGSFPIKLQSLTIQLFCISRLPDLSSCSQLSYLKLSCERSLKVLPNMSGLRKLLKLEIESCHKLVEIPGIGKLHCLTSLLIKNCPALECLENLRELQELKAFSLFSCGKLTEIRGLGELKALSKVIVKECESLGKFDNLKVLKELKKATLVGCRKLADSSGGEVPGHGEYSLNQLENVSVEAQGDRHHQLPLSYRGRWHRVSRCLFP